MNHGSIWTTLGIPATSDEAEIRRAYARRLKEVHPEDDAEGFQALRHAYEAARRMAGHRSHVRPAQPPPKRRKPRPSRPDQHPAPPPMSAGDEDASWPDEARREWERQAPNETPEGLSARAKVAEQERAHRLLCDDLQKQLRNRDLSQADLVGALIRVFRSAAMESLQVHEQTEHWLAQLIGSGPMAADALVYPAIEYFRWDTNRIGADAPHAFAVLQRRQRMQAVRDLQREGFPGHEAYKALRRPPTIFNRLRDRLHPGLGAQVQTLLDRLSYELRGVDLALDPRAVEVWKARLARPVLAPVYLWVTLAAPVLFGLFLPSWGDFGPGFLPIVVAGWLAGTGGLSLLGVGYIHAIARPARNWRQGSPWGRPLWLRVGWAAGALALPLLAALLPAGTPTVVALGLLAIPLAGWARVTGSHVARPPVERIDWTRYVGALPILIWTLLFGSFVGLKGASLLMAMAGAAIVLTIGQRAILDVWSHAAPRHRRIVCFVIVGVAMTAVMLLWLAQPAGLGAFAMALTGALALADRALTWGVANTYDARRGILIIGALLALVIANWLPLPGYEANSFFAFGLVFILAALATVGATLKPPRPAKRRGKGQFA